MSRRRVDLLPTSVLIVLLFVFNLSLAMALQVSHDGRSLILDGERKIIVSGAIHYPRSTPEAIQFKTLLYLICGWLLISTHTYVFVLMVQMWPDLIQKGKDGGLDAIETYVFWNAHEPRRRQVM